ncbi:MAG: hypothetical protein QF805_02470 [Pirellulaceae bacterium]|jgi:hypothetical protein|nr:hypothetical protein [Pirellulaceae bacterium]
MRIGLDFDNTIVCYDGIFHALAVERELIPASTPAHKQAVRDHLRAVGREDDWTRLQGVVYGEEILRAVPFPDACETIRRCAKLGADLVLISHRTRTPALGPDVDLHQAARRWLTSQQLDDCFREIHFAETRAAKYARIAETTRECFVDDLPEFLRDASFPESTQRVLFDPAHQHADCETWIRVNGWRELATWIEEQWR